MHNAGKLGALLLQFPWSFRRTEANQQWLDDVARVFDEFPLVVEVRHASWAVPEFYGELAEQGLGFVNIDQPLFCHSVKPSATTTSPVGYVRIHGRNYHEWFRKRSGCRGALRLPVFFGRVGAVGGAHAPGGGGRRTMTCTRSRTTTIARRRR